MTQIRPACFSLVCSTKKPVILNKTLMKKAVYPYTGGTHTCYLYGYIHHCNEPRASIPIPKLVPVLPRYRGTRLVKVVYWQNFRSSKIEKLISENFLKMPKSCQHFESSKNSLFGFLQAKIMPQNCQTWQQNCQIGRLINSKTRPTCHKGRLAKSRLTHRIINAKYYATSSDLKLRKVLLTLHKILPR